MEYQAASRFSPASCHSGSRCSGSFPIGRTRPRCASDSRKIPIARIRRLRVRRPGMTGTVPPDQSSHRSIVASICSEPLQATGAVATSSVATLTSLALQGIRWITAGRPRTSARMCTFLSAAARWICQALLPRRMQGQRGRLTQPTQEPIGFRPYGHSRSRWSTRPWAAFVPAAAERLRIA